MLCKLASKLSQPKLCQLICTYTYIQTCIFVFTERMWYPNVRMVTPVCLKLASENYVLYYTMTLSNLLTPNM